MHTSLKKPLSRELTSLPGVIVTLTEDGIIVKVKRHQSSVTIPWAEIIGVDTLDLESRSCIEKRGISRLVELGYELKDKLTIKLKKNDS